MKETQEVTLIELKRLLVDLKEKRPDIGVRFRLVGELWSRSFSEIVLITEKGVVLNDQSGNKLYTIPDLSDIMQFEIEGPFYNFQPYNHYDVKPIPVF